MAQDRAWQLDVERRRAEGTCAEVFGEAAAEWDELARRAGVVDTARRAYDALSPESRAFTDAYVAGVNTTLAAPWQGWTPLAVFAAQHLLFSGFPSQLWRRHLAATAGPEWVDLFRVEGLPGGSNAFVVDGSLTASGLPIVAGDPHRLIEAPNCYAQVRLVCTDPDDSFDVTGLCFPGVPGVQHFGHAGAVAWGITNAVADDEDVDVDAEGFRVRNPASVLGNLGLDTTLGLLRARTAVDVTDAFAHWVGPVNNLLVADRYGAVEHRVVGRVPERDADRRWTGWVTDLPRRTGPVLVTANDRATPDHGRIGADFAPPHRARRIRALLEERLAEGPLTVAAAAEVLADVRQNAGGALLDVIAGLELDDPAAAALRDRLVAWDRAMTVGSVDAALFAAVRAAVVETLYDAPVLAGVDVSPYGELFRPWFDLRGRIRLCLPTILAADRPFGVDVREAVSVALSTVAAADEPEPWGSAHVVVPLTPHQQFGLPAPVPVPSVPVPGDDDCVFAARSTGGTGACVHGPVARWVWDLAGESRWVVPLGASGDPASPHHHDQQAVWAAGGTLAVSRP
jgi:penicillin amidase